MGNRNVLNIIVCVPFSPTQQGTNISEFKSKGTIQYSAK